MTVDILFIRKGHDSFLTMLNPILIQAETLNICGRLRASRNLPTSYMH